MGVEELKNFRVNLKFQRNDLDAVLMPDRYSPGELVELFQRGVLLEVDGETRPEYDQEVHVGTITLAEHSLAVLRRFEEYFSDKPLPAGLNKNLFRILLVIHDIGKPLGGIHGQHEYTLKLVTEILRELEIPESDIKIILALICADPIGYYLRGEPTHPDLGKVVDEIQEMAEISGLPIEHFFELLLVFYTVDASSYDHLSHLFILDEVKKQISYSREVNSVITTLRRFLQVQGHL